MPVSELVRGIHPRNHVAKFGVDPLHITVISGKHTNKYCTDTARNNTFRKSFFFQAVTKNNNNKTK